MARPTITNIQLLGDFAVANRWDITASNIPGLPGEDLNFRAISCDVPKRTGSTVEVSIRGHKVRQPGDYEYNSPITITLAETDDYKVHKAINIWREMISMSITGVQLPKLAVQTIVIINRLNRQNVTTHTWTLLGCFLEDYETGDMSDAGDALNPTLTLAYDYFIEV